MQFDVRILRKGLNTGCVVLRVNVSINLCLSQSISFPAPIADNLSVTHHLKFTLLRKTWNILQAYNYSSSDLILFLTLAESLGECAMLWNSSNVSMTGESWMLMSLWNVAMARQSCLLRVPRVLGSRHDLKFWRLLSQALKICFCMLHLLCSFGRRHHRKSPNPYKLKIDKNQIEGAQSFSLNLIS